MELFEAFQNVGFATEVLALSVVLQAERQETVFSLNVGDLGSLPIVDDEGGNFFC